VVSFQRNGNQSTKGWDAKKQSQTLTAGDSFEVTLQGEGVASLQVAMVGWRGLTEDVCTLRELPGGDSTHRRFVITAKKRGTVALEAGQGLGEFGGRIEASINIQVNVRLVFFPGERTVKLKFRSGKIEDEAVGTIYVVGGEGERFSAAGGPRKPSKDPKDGGHSKEPTPAGRYVLGPQQHVTTSTWTASVIPWGATIRINAQGEAEYKGDTGGWRLATGPNGEVTAAEINFATNSPTDKRTRAQIIADVRDMFIDPTTKKLWSTTWEQNDFGKWGWNLRAMPGLRPTAYFIHTTPANEEEDAARKAVLLTNSHGCIHIIPSEREQMMHKGYLQEGVEFEVRPYTEMGPP
jgi:hypothetical protein